MGNYNVHIITLKKEICSLIRKTLDTNRYELTCTSGEAITESFLDSFDKKIHCLILDKGLDKEISRKIKEKFDSIPIICLPSLGGEGNESNNVKYISEPFKLSELKSAVDEVCNEV